MIFVWCVHQRQQCIKQVTPFKEEPGQSILQADSDELSSFFTICKFYTNFQNQIWLWYTTALCLNNGTTLQSFPLYKMQFEQNWSLPRGLIALANFVRAEDSIDQGSGSDQSALHSEVSKAQNFSSFSDQRHDNYFLMSRILFYLLSKTSWNS